MTLDQDIGGFDAAVIGPRIASWLGVSVSRVQVSVEVGSVIMTASVQADGDSQLAAIVGVLNALTPAFASDALGTPVLSIDTVARVGELSPPPPLPPRPQPQQDLPVAVMAVTSIVSTAATMVLLAVLVFLCACKVRARGRRWSGAQGTAASTYSASSPPVVRGTPIIADAQMDDEHAMQAKQPAGGHSNAPPAASTSTGQARYPGAPSRSCETLSYV